LTATTIAVDLGGTHVRAALVAGGGEVLVRDRRDTPSGDPTPAVVPALIEEMRAQAGSWPTPSRAVVGVPGIVDHESERLVHAPNLPPGWLGHLNESWLSAKTGLPVAMANDADLAAVGESSFGAGRGHRDVVFVTVSTGVGAGLVVADRLVRGAFSGGEVGHTVIDRVAAAEGRPCTVEDLGSGTAIVRAARAAGIAEDGTAVADLVRRGDDRATGIWNAAMVVVGLGIVNLAWIVAPHVVVIGGGVGMNGDLVLPIVREQLRRFGPVSAETIEVVNAALGDDAALAGAAAWWKAVGRER
jgi:glucokinase